MAATTTDTAAMVHVRCAAPYFQHDRREGVMPVLSSRGCCTRMIQDNLWGECANVGFTVIMYCLFWPISGLSLFVREQHAESVIHILYMTRTSSYTTHPS